MQISRLKAVRLHYEAKAAEAEETIKVYLTNAVGIGEHPQVTIHCENGFVYKSMDRGRGTIQVLNSDGTPLKCGQKIK